MTLYLFSVLENLKGILKKIRTPHMPFLWGGATKEKKWALVAWDKLRKPKTHGGISIRDPLHVSRALATKILKRWITYPKSFWWTSYGKQNILMRLTLRISFTWTSSTGDILSRIHPSKTES
jgi:hypothetical protein